MIVRNKLSVEDVKRVTAGFVRGFVVCLGLLAVCVAVLIRFDELSILVIDGVFIVLLLIAALIHLLMIWSSRQLKVEALMREGNFFLHDASAGTDHAIEELNVTAARNKLHGYMRLFLDHGKMYLGQLFDKNGRVPECFKPLICYDVLITLAEEGQSLGSMVLLGNGDEFASTFYDYLSYAGDAETGRRISDFVYKFKTQRELAAAEFLNFVKENREYLEERFMIYIREHIREFD